MQVHAATHAAHQRGVPAARRTDPAPVPATQTATSATDVTTGEVPASPAPETVPPTSDEVGTLQREARVVPPGLARKGVEDANGDGRVDGRDVAFARHGVDHPGRGFTPEHVGGTIEVPVDPTPVEEPPVELTELLDEGADQDA